MSGLNNLCEVLFSTILSKFILRFGYLVSISLSITVPRCYHDFILWNSFTSLGCDFCALQYLHNLWPEDVSGRLALHLEHILCNLCTCSCINSLNLKTTKQYRHLCGVSNRTMDVVSLLFLHLRRFLILNIVLPKQLVDSLSGLSIILKTPYNAY